jgi:hypothetical protein
VVTVFYLSAASYRVAVSWFGPQAMRPAGAIPTDTVAGRPILVVDTTRGPAVIDGDPPLSRLYEVASWLRVAPAWSRLAGVVMAVTARSPLMG